MYVLLFQFWAIAILMSLILIIMVFGNIIIWMHVSTVLPTAVFCHRGWHCFIPRAIWFLIKCVLINQVYFIYIFFLIYLKIAKFFQFIHYTFLDYYMFTSSGKCWFPLYLHYTVQLIKVCTMKTNYRYLILHGHFFNMIRHIPYLIRPWA